MSRLLLIRHAKARFQTGDRFWGSTDIELSEEGVVQAGQLRQKLAAEKQIDTAAISGTGRGGRVTKFSEKPELDKPVSIGILALNGRAFGYLEKLSTDKSEIDVMGDLIPRLIADDEPVYAHLTNSFWYDVGSTEKYEKLGDGRVERYLGYLFR